VCNSLASSKNTPNRSSPAIGSTLGWRLAQNPLAKISVVCRSNYSAVRHCGIHLTTQLWGSGTFTPHRVVRSTHEVSYIPFDYVICANKATGPSLVHELAPAISAKTALVSVQNGVGVEAPLRQAFRDNTVLSAVCYISCTQPTPGCVEQVSHIRPHAFHIGTYSSSPSFTNPNVLQDFVALDPKFKQINNVQAERWTKQIFNGAWNPTTAITNLNTHDLLSSPHLHMVKQLATETFNVARALGIDLPDDLPERTIELAREHKALEPSMLQDRRAGRRMEVEALCGKSSSNRLTFPETVY
jgi:2-dehydropantoate 2-reductase